jgi:hypothetical protein
MIRGHQSRFMSEIIRKKAITLVETTTPPRSLNFAAESTANIGKLTTNQPMKLEIGTP